MFQLNNVDFEYTEKILNQVTLHVEENKIGVIGINGIGKTTFLKLLHKELIPQSGEVAVEGDTYFIDFDLSHYIKFTLIDLLELCSELKSFCLDEQQSYIEKLHLQAFLNKPIGTLSKGVTKKVALLIGLLTIHDVLLIDEPFESIDHQSNKNLVEIFQNSNRKMVIVSHDFNYLQQSTNKIYELIDGKLVQYHD